MKNQKIKLHKMQHSKPLRFKGMYKHLTGDKKNITVCHSTLHEYFEFPEHVTEIMLTVSTREHKEAYKIGSIRSSSGYTYALRIQLASSRWKAETTYWSLDQALNDIPEGEYRWVSLDYFE